MGALVLKGDGPITEARITKPEGGPNHPQRHHNHLARVRIAGNAPIPVVKLVCDPGRELSAGRASDVLRTPVFRGPRVVVVE
jgi:hypothetical protein